ncbi:MAG: hypothetical protein Q8M16_03110 [Pirellulaceae bacterium]|nr:hypothetical protein [Pirellulaceae bacterium]
MALAKDRTQISNSNPARPLSLVCGGCGCWCDDIDWDSSRPHEYRSACELGRRYFERLGTRSVGSGPPDNESLAELANALRDARRPLLTGLHQSCLETQRLVVAIADRCQAVIDPFLSDAARSKTLAFQQSGEISASWGEVKNRADVVIYWRCQPERAPRFRQRYGDQADGEFVQPADRTVIVVDSNPEPVRWQDDASASQLPRSLQFVAIDQDDRITLEQLISASQQPCPPDNHGDFRDANPGGNQVKPVWWPIHEALSHAKYAAIVIGELQTGADCHDPTVGVPLYQLLQRWTAAWNDQRRCVVVPFPGAVNHCRTAQSVLTWRTGYPMSVDFSAGFPRYDAVAFHWRELLARDEVDFVLHFSGDSVLEPANAPWAAANQRLTQWADQKPLWEIGAQQTIPRARRFLSTLTARTSATTRQRTVGRPDGILLPISVFPSGTVNREPEITEQLWSLLNRLSVEAP